MDTDTLKTVLDLTPVAKAIIVALGVMGPAIGIGLIFSKAAEGTARNPEASNKIFMTAIIGAGMVEIFGLASIGLFFML